MVPAEVPLSSQHQLPASKVSILHITPSQTFKGLQRSLTSDHNLMTDPTPKLPKWDFPKFLTHRGCENLKDRKLFYTVGFIQQQWSAHSTVVPSHVSPSWHFGFHLSTFSSVSFHSNPQKRQCQKKCSNCHTIALISHASKVMLKILQARLQQYVNRELPDIEAGFRKGRGTRDQIANFC